MGVLIAPANVGRLPAEKRAWSRRAVANHNETQAWGTVLDRDDNGPQVCLYDLSPIGESRIAKYIAAMTKPFTLLTSAACFLALLSFAPTAPAQNPAAEEKVIGLGQQLKLTPQQEVEVLPILKEEAPKFEAIKNDPSLSGMQKMKQLHALHSENAPELQKILSPAQYQELQEIREQDIKKAIAAKRAGR
ncbi:MAG TPA: hypothetical protein VFR76_04140 [Verrucomicrobiae bacterium]|nr:hypothetical protein [Verrucomicrobiae bacterium]